MNRPSLQHCPPGTQYDAVTEMCDASAECIEIKCTFAGPEYLPYAFNSPYFIFCEVDPDTREINQHLLKCETDWVFDVVPYIGCKPIDTIDTTTNIITESTTTESTTRTESTTTESTTITELTTTETTTMAATITESTTRTEPTTTETTTMAAITTTTSINTPTTASNSSLMVESSCDLRELVPGMDISIHNIYLKHIKTYNSN
jgi:hypothetical protein